MTPNDLSILFEWIRDVPDNRLSKLKINLYQKWKIIRQLYYFSFQHTNFPEKILSVILTTEDMVKFDIIKEKYNSTVFKSFLKQKGSLFQSK